MPGSDNDQRDIVTKASYSLDERRRAWEIVLNHLKATGKGHGAFLSLMQNSITAARENGLRILDYAGKPLNVEALKKDDLFGFLGGTRNPRLGPHRQISDAKFAVMDAYFLLIHEALWVEALDPRETLIRTLSDFWNPDPAPMLFLRSHLRKSLWFTSAKSLREEVWKETRQTAVRAMSISAIRIWPASNTLFHVFLVKVPLVSDFVLADDDVFEKVSVWNGQLDENPWGLRVYQGCGCWRLGSGSKNEMITVLHDRVTREPETVDLSLNLQAASEEELSLADVSVLENGIVLEKASFNNESKAFEKDGKILFNDFFFKRISQILVPLTMGKWADLT